MTTGYHANCYFSVTRGNKESEMVVPQLFNIFAFCMSSFIIQNISEIDRNDHFFIVKTVGVRDSSKWTNVNHSEKEKENYEE